MNTLKNILKIGALISLVGGVSSQNAVAQEFQALVEQSVFRSQDERFMRERLVQQLFVFEAHADFFLQMAGA